MDLQIHTDLLAAIGEEICMVNKVDINKEVGLDNREVLTNPVLKANGAATIAVVAVVVVVVGGTGKEPVTRVTTPRDIQLNHLNSLLVIYFVSLVIKHFIRLVAERFSSFGEGFN